MTQRKYSEEYKHEAVQLVIEQGLSIGQTAGDLGIGKSTLDKWVRAAKKARKPGEEQVSESEKAELKRLRKENYTLRMERDILKKATAYFAKTTL